MTFFSKTFKRALQALSVGALAAFGAPAKADYVGGGYLIPVQGFEAAGWPTGVQMFRARYLPREVEGTRSTLTIDTAVGGTFSYIVWSELSESTSWRAAFGYSVWGEVYAPRPRPQVRVMERASSTTGGASIPQHPEIRLQVRIRHFNGVRGCIVQAHMMLRDRDTTRPIY